MLTGKFIGAKEDVSVFTVEKNFTLSVVGKAVLRVTALGLYFAEINGVRVGDCYLTPGWTDYKTTLQVQEYDVSALLHKGENTLSFTVGKGWYRGRIERSDGDIYGSQLAVCADLILSYGIISTDESWRARESYIRESGIYDGEAQDFTAELKPLTVCEVPFDKSALVEQICEPVRNIERLEVKEIIRTPKGELVYDFGQNMAGVVEIKTPEDFNGTLTLQFAEILINGDFYTDNLRSAKATDTFTVKGAKTLCPEFTYHGFRYMKLTGAELPKENVTAIVRHTDMKRTGYIQTDNARFNRLYQNVIWGQKGNFVDVPTDCPQRDERLGWTGDINAFCTTAAYNYDIRLFMKKWFADLRNGQAESGEICCVAPELPFIRRGSFAFWCDALVMVPWKLYRMYGDISFLSDNYEAMKKYLFAKEKNVENGLIVKGFEYGDWTGLDKEECVCKEWNFRGGTDEYFLANAFYAHCLELIAEIASLLKIPQDEEKYRLRYQALLAKIREEYFTASGRLAVPTVTAKTVALCLGIVEERYRSRLAKELNEHVLRHECRVTTGFIGTPYLLFALADNGYFETAQRVLMNGTCPGWLYEVDMGATTVWERWNGIQADGKPISPQMNSMNHYANGAVMEFVYRRIAGIEPIEAGFRKIKIAPHPMKGLARMQCEYDSVNGKIISGYAQKGGKIKFTVQIPSGTEGIVCLPKEEPFSVNAGKFVFEREWETLSVMPYTPESYVYEVFGNPLAVRAFNAVFGGIFTGTEIAWMVRDNKTLGFMAEFRDMEGKMKLADFHELLKKANELFLQYER